MGEGLAYKIVKSPLGDLKVVASGQGIVAILWPNDDPQRVPLGAMDEQPEQPLLVQAETQLGEYFAGTRTVFEVPLDLRGTEFQKKVWGALLEIPFGETRSYGEIADLLGDRNAVRAVGAANGKNPVSIIAPCHRVVGSDGKLTGFAGGVEAKAYLLDLEGGGLFSPRA